MAHSFYELLSNIIIFKYITQQQAMEAPHALILWKDLAADKDPYFVLCGRTCTCTVIEQQQAAGTPVSVTQEYRGNYRSAAILATLQRPQRVRVTLKRKESNFSGTILAVMGGARMVTCAADDAEGWNL